MKKLLTILGAVGLTATGASSVVACNKDEEKAQDLKVISSYNEDQKTQITTAVSNAIVTTTDKTAGEDTDAYKAINAAVIDTLKTISGVTNLDGTKVQVNVLNEDKTEFTSNHSVFTNGDKIVIAMKNLPDSALTGTLEVSLTVTDQVIAIDLSKVTITVPDQTIAGDKSTADDVTAITTAINDAVKNNQGLKDLTLWTDYEITGLDKIVEDKTPEELSALTFTVKAKSDKVSNETPAFSVKVTKATA